MTNRLFSVVLLVVVSAVLAACGSSSSSSSSSSSAPSSSASPASTAGSSSSAAPSSPGGGSASPTLAAGVARCKASIAAAPTLSADAKNKLQSLCDQAANGDPTQLRKATAQVCQQIVKESVPASAQQQALASCPKP